MRFKYRIEDDFINYIFQNWNALAGLGRQPEKSVSHSGFRCYKRFYEAICGY